MSQGVGLQGYGAISVCRPDDLYMARYLDTSYRVLHILAGTTLRGQVYSKYKHFPDVLEAILGGLGALPASSGAMWTIYPTSDMDHVS